MPSFVIGIGSQRAGSTLLHKILDECTPIFMHPLKELHYYDTLYGVRDETVLKEFSRRQLDRELDRLISSNNYRYIDKKYKCYIRANKTLLFNSIKDIEYMDLYSPCISSGIALGEITPEYMILPEIGIRRMATDIGPDAKIILLTRDPVERFISSYKLLVMYGGRKYNKETMSRDIMRTIKSMPKWVAQQRELNDYGAAAERYRKYFKNVLVLSYEDIVLNSRKFFKKLEEFLEVPVNAADGKIIMRTKVNSMGESGEIGDELRAQLRDIIVPSHG